MWKNSLEGEEDRPCHQYLSSIYLLGNVLSRNWCFPFELYRCSGWNSGSWFEDLPVSPFIHVEEYIYFSFHCFCLKNYSPHVFFLQDIFLELTIPIVRHIRPRSPSWYILLVMCLWWLHISLTFLSCQSSGALKPFSVLHLPCGLVRRFVDGLIALFFHLSSPWFQKLRKTQHCGRLCFLHSTDSSVVSFHCDFQGRSALFWRPRNACIAERLIFLKDIAQNWVEDQSSPIEHQLRPFFVKPASSILLVGFATCKVCDMHKTFNFSTPISLSVNWG